MSDNSWRYRIGNVEYGPVTAEDLCRLFLSNQVPLDASVWCAPIERWVPANSIPAFRAAAATAPNAAPPPPPESDGTFYRNAARAAWAAPLTVFVVSYCANSGLRAAGEGGIPDPKGQIIVGLTAAAFILCGFFAGVIALVGAPSHVRRRILVPALLGVCFNGLVILAGIYTVTVARGAFAGQVQFEAEARTSFLEFPGWIGAVNLPGGGAVIAATLDDQSPIAKRLLGPLHTRCSLVNITVVNPGGGSGVQFYDPNSLELLSADGNLRPLPPDAVLAGAPPGASTLIRRFVGTQMVPADGKPHDALCFIPPGVDLHSVWAVRLDLDGKRVTLPGRLCTAAQKQKYYLAGKNAALMKRPQ